MKISLLIITFLGIAVMFINQSSKAATYNDSDNELQKIRQSPQYKAGKFRNAKAWIQPPVHKFLGIVWSFLFNQSERYPADSLPRVPVDLTYFSDSKLNQLNVTWLGHSSLMINVDGYKILTDPVFEKSVSFFGPTRYNGEVPLDIAALPEVDVVIISHNHYDHLNKYSIEILNSKTKRFITTLGIGAQLKKWGVQTNKITELDWWEEIPIDSVLLIAATPAQHFSGRGLTDRDKTLWASWVIKSVNHKIFFGGDSGYFEGFKKIGEKYGPFDMTFLECGAYNQNWRHIHMFPEDAVQAHKDLKGNILHPIHWGTFNLSLHPWYEPMERLSAAADSAKIQIATPVVGGTTDFNATIAENRWWKPYLTGKKK